MYFIKENNKINLYNEKIKNMIQNLDDCSSIAFTDGSYSNKSRKGGYGVILLTNKSEFHFLKSFNSSKYSHSEILKLHSVGLECEAVKRAIQEAINLNKQNISIFYDYEGIEKWINHEWNLSSNYANDYYDSIIKFSKQISISFNKIKSHSGIYYNDLVDRLAKSALNKY